MEEHRDSWHGGIICLVRVLVAIDRALRTQVSFLAYCDDQKGIEHVTSALRAHHIREALCRPTNALKLIISM